MIVDKLYFRQILSFSHIMPLVCIAISTIEDATFDKVLHLFLKRKSSSV